MHAIMIDKTFFKPIPLFILKYIYLSLQVIRNYYKLYRYNKVWNLKLSFLFYETGIQYFTEPIARHKVLYNEWKLTTVSNFLFQRGNTFWVLSVNFSFLNKSAGLSCTKLVKFN